MSIFLTSLALVAVAQIPLLLKLWLDHKAKTSSYKLELYRRQLDAFRTLSTLASEVHRNTDLVMQLASESSLPNRNDEFLKNITMTFHKDWSTFHKQFQEFEFLLPAETVTTLARFSTCAVRILCKAAGWPETPETRPLTLPNLWREQDQYFTGLLNQMRLVCGIDTLSSQVFKELNNPTQHRMLRYSHTEYEIAERNN